MLIILGFALALFRNGIEDMFGIKEKKREEQEKRNREQKVQEQYEYNKTKSEERQRIYDITHQAYKEVKEGKFKDMKKASAYYGINEMWRNYYNN